MTRRATVWVSPPVLSLRRISAMVVRYVLLLKNSWTRIFELVYWPTIQMVLWGFISEFLRGNSTWVAQAAVGNSMPLGRMGTPTDLANACVFLASPLASYVTGSTLTVHGGGERPAFLEEAQVDHEDCS